MGKNRIKGVVVLRLTPPKMILFDYGHTLLHEPEFDTLRGVRALFPFFTGNPDALTPEEIDGAQQALFAELAPVRRAGVEPHEWPFLRFSLGLMGLGLSVPLPEAERIFWDAASPGAVMPGAEEMLDAVGKAGIRSGVISNIAYSGGALAARLGRLLPRHRFEFVLASSEYLFRKPDRRLFALALKKAELRPEEVWFCGDNVAADVGGAAGAGIFPVWYDERRIRNLWAAPEDGEPACPHLHVRSWAEFTACLRECGALEPGG